MSIHDPRPTTHGIRRERGVTLIEMIMVIVITGIIGVAIAVFIRRPVEGYVDAAQRAGLTDIADTALRRMTRDLRTALPNSIRVDPTGKYIEFLQTRGGGRYRSEKESDGTTGDTLNFSDPTGDTSFDVIGPWLASLAVGDLIVVYNLGPGSGVSDAYTGGNSSDVTSFAAPQISITAKQFPFPSPGKRFQVVQYPVTYACEAGVLRRYWGYTIAAAQPTPPAIPPGNSALLATNVVVADCAFSYTEISQRAGTVALSMRISQSGESVRLFQQVHVNNVP